MINIKSDSRKVKKGDIFVALDGINSNGSCYIQNAIEAGAKKIVCKQGNFNVETINVKDPKKYLTDYLVSNYNKYLSSMTLIGITGTNGKTTTAYLIYQMLNNMGLKCAYIGTIGFYLEKKICNLPNTSPDTCDLYDMFMKAYENKFKYIVIEVSSQGLSYNRFDGIRFDYAIFTNLTMDHLDFHKTMENYAKAKQKLFLSLKESGVGIVNIDSKYNEYFNCKKKVSYGIQDGDYQVPYYKLTENNTFIEFKHDNKIYKFTYPLIGKYNIYNMLASLSLIDQLKIDINKIDFNKIKSPSGRMEKIKYKDNVIVIDYAHTPDAMENLYKTILPLAKGSVITVFGCTGSREKDKRPIMMSLACENSSYVYVTSDDLHEEKFEDIVNDMLPGATRNNFKVVSNRGLAIKEAFLSLKEKDMLLILGKGHEEFIVVGNKKIPFNDHNEILKLIKSSNTVDTLL